MSGGSRRKGTVFRPRFFSDDQAGFTIAEYIAAVAILLTVVIAAMSAIMYSSTANALTQRRYEARNKAEKVMEEARNISEATLSGWEGTSEPIEDGPYTIVKRGFYSADDTNSLVNAFNVEVTISWKTPRPGSISTVTRVYTKTDTVNGDVHINVVTPKDDGTTEPLSGVTIKLTKTAKARQTTTNAQGVAVLGRVPAGSNADFAAQRSGYVVDYSTKPTSLLVVGGEITKASVTAHLASSIRYRFVVQGGGTPPDVKVTLKGAKTTPDPLEGDNVLFKDLLPDTYLVTFNVPAGYVPVSALPTSESIPKGGTEIERTFEFTKQTLLTATVTDDRGGNNYVNQATVTLTNSSGGWVAQGSTNAQGKVTLAVPASGNYTVTASKSNYVDGATSKTITLGTDTSATLGMTRYGTLRCRYTSGSSNTTLYVYNADKVLVASGSTSGSGSSRRAEFPLPPAGFYYVSTRSSWPTSGYSPVKSPAVVPGATTADVLVTSSN